MIGAVVIAALSFGACTGGVADKAIMLDQPSGRLISDKLLGFNIVYAGNPDKVWEDGSLAAAIKATRPGFLRYPGGTVNTFFHWQTPTGNGWADCWDPSYDHAKDKAPSEYMDIDEYLHLIDQTGAEPLLGINVTSGFVWDRLEDGIQEALDLMKYCKSKGYDVKYWYMGNEPYQHDCNGGEVSPERYGEMINAFVPRMKEVDPDIKVIANWRATFRKNGDQYDGLFRVAGHNIDIIDVHWYCMWGNASWEEWIAKTPCGVFLGDSYESEIGRFKEICSKNGVPDMKLASLEWNVGPGKRSTAGKLNADQSAMVQAEMMIQFMRGGLDIATMWPLFWDSQYAARSFVDKKTGQLMPTAQIQARFGAFQGMELIETPYEDGSPILTLAARDPQSGRVKLCVMNKSAQGCSVSVAGALTHRLVTAKMECFHLTGDSYDTLCCEKQYKVSKKNVILYPYSLAFIDL